MNVYNMTIQDVLDMIKVKFPNKKCTLGKSRYRGGFIYSIMSEGKILLASFIFNDLKEKLVKNQQRGGIK